MIRCFKTIIWFIIITTVILSPVNGQIQYDCDPNLECGCSSSPVIISKIFGGQTARNHTWGWAVSILMNNILFCGGTLISDSWILTSAACVISYRPSEIVVSVATNQLLGLKQGRYVSDIVVHEAFNYETAANDIALLQVSPPFDMTDPGIARICLPASTMINYPSMNSTVTDQF